MPKAAAPGREERLQIRSFGPIETADITVRPLTVGVGPQATGKSLTAQLLYFMRGIEELVNPSSDYESSINELAASWFDQNILKTAVNSAALFESGFTTHWQPNEIIGSVLHPCSLSTEGRDTPLLRGDEALMTRIRAAQTNDGSFRSPEVQVYVPAGRLLCSLVKPGLAVSLLNRGRLDWPGFLSLFYEKLESAIKSLPTERIRLFLPDRSIAEFVRAKSQSSLKGRLFRDARNNVEIVGQLRAVEAVAWTLVSSGLASGQLETWPLWTILLAHLQSPQNKRIFIEEPEAHVHPTAQRDIMEALVTLLHHNFRFVITTHSPYVIYALNNALLAGQVQKAGRKLPKGISEEFALAKEDIAAYRFTPDGQVLSLFDPETGLLDTGELDDPAAALSAQFTDLQDALHPDEE